MVNRHKRGRGPYQPPRPGFFDPDGSLKLHGGLGPVEPWKNAPRHLRRKGLLAPPPQRKPKPE